MEWSKCKRFDEVVTNVFTRIVRWQNGHKRVSTIRRALSIHFVQAHNEFACNVTRLQYARAVLTAGSLCVKFARACNEFFRLNVSVCQLDGTSCSVLRTPCTYRVPCPSGRVKHLLHLPKCSCNDFSSGAKCRPNMHERYYVTYYIKMSILSTSSSTYRGARTHKHSSMRVY